MFGTKPKKKLTNQQRNAEQEAVRTLTRVQNMLQVDESNLPEARKLRNYVVHELLPKNHLKIMRTHPKSLLLDIDRRIQRAETRLYTQKRSSGDSAKVSHPDRASKASVTYRKRRSPATPKRDSESPAFLQPRISKVLEERAQKVKQRYSDVATQVDQRNHAAMISFLCVAVLTVAVVLLMKQYFGAEVFYSSFDWLPATR